MLVDTIFRNFVRWGGDTIFCSVCSKIIKRWCFSIIELIHCLCMQMLQNNSFISHTKWYKLSYWSVYAQLLDFMIVQNSICLMVRKKEKYYFLFILINMHYPLQVFFHRFFWFFLVFLTSRNHRVTEWLGALERTSGDQLVQPTC